MHKNEEPTITLKNRCLFSGTKRILLDSAQPQLSRRATSTPIATLYIGRALAPHLFPSWHIIFISRHEDHVASPRVLPRAYVWRRWQVQGEQDDHSHRLQGQEAVQGGGFRELFGCKLRVIDRWIILLLILLRTLTPYFHLP